MAEKPHLCLGLLHDYAARDFLDSGVLDELAAQWHLSFVAGPDLTLDLAAYGPIFRYPKLSGLRWRIVQVARGLWYMHDKKAFESNRAFALARACFGFGPTVTRVIDFVSRIGLARPAALALRLVLRWSAPESFSSADRPDAVLAYTSVNSYFTDDLVREARRKAIPLLAVTNNWDNINLKSFLEIPPYLGVWGEQGFLAARLMHRIAAHRVFVTGSPRFEIYRKRKVDRTEARGTFGVEAHQKVLLFCGAGASFEETSLLEELDSAISTGQLPREVTILYKPHPSRMARHAERPLDMSKLRHVRLVSSVRGLSELSIYPGLLMAADGVISPFSTMVMEGALHGLPALCLGYADPGHANYDWNRVSFNLHLYLIRHGDWAVICNERRMFIEKVKDLLQLCGRKDVARFARASAEMMSRTGQESVAQRLSAAVQRLLAGLDADESLARSRSASQQAAAVVREE